MNHQIETAVILLAGRGSRLEELTNNKPKCLVEVNHTPILTYMLDDLADFGVKTAILVVGYLSEQIIQYVGATWKNMDVEYVVNDDWNNSNNVVSLYMALGRIKTNFLLLEGDIVISANALKLFSGLNMMAVDRYRSYMDGTVVSLNEQNEVTRFYLKSSSDRPDNLEGYFKTVNIYSFGRSDFFKYIEPCLDEIIKTERLDVYYELAFARAVNSEQIKLKAIDFKHVKWAEIDDQKDLQYAEKLFDHQKIS